MRSEHKRLLLNAIEKARGSGDRYSLEKFEALYNRGRDLDNTELYDVKLYLGEVG